MRIFIILALLLKAYSPQASACADAYGEEPVADRDVARVEQVLMEPIYPWLVPHANSVAAQFPKIYQEVQTGIKDRVLFKEASLAKKELLNGTLSAKEYLFKITELHNELATYFHATGQALRNRTTQSKTAAHLFHQAAGNIKIPTNFQQSDKMPLGRVIVRQHRDLLRESTRAKPTIKWVRRVNERFNPKKFSAIWFELLVAISIENPVGFGVYGYELATSKIVKKKLTKTEANSEIDILSIEGGQYVIYETKYFGSRLGSTEHWGRIKSQMLRLLAIAGQFKSAPARVVVVAKSGFTREAESWFRANGVEMLGPDN